MPAIVGWHPWFPRVLRDGAGAAVGGPVVVDLDAGGMLRVAPTASPTAAWSGRSRPSRGTTASSMSRGAPGVAWPGALELRIDSDAGYWVVYTEREDGVCVEPQTGPPNGLATGDHAVVEPGAPLVAP